jgi:Protein of unknown function (DUF4058)
MPSPFPGMDPYLEHPAVFPGLHDRMITHLSDELQVRLPEPYYAEISDRLWVEVSERSIEPDVNVLEGREGMEKAPLESVQNGGTVATLARPVVITVPHDEFREPYLEIIARTGDEDRIVTTVEILSPTNKRPGARGRDLYLQKQREILGSATHLVEIDLLRGGEHTTAVPHARAVHKAGRFDYHVCVHRADRFEDYFVYPILIRDSLPVIEIPLLPDTAPVELDLQAVFNLCYDRGPYHRRIRYLENELVPPLREEDRDWAAALVAGSLRE